MLRANVLFAPVLARIVTGAALSAPILTGSGLAGQAAVEFQKDIAPILLQRCVKCHGAEKQKGDLRLDRRAHVFPEDTEVWTVQPGKPDDSELLRRLGLPADDDDRMPNEGEPLAAEQIDLVRRWIAAGADWPAAADEVFVAAEQAAIVPKITFALPEVAAAAAQKIDAALARLRELGAVAQGVAADTKAVDVNCSLLHDRIGDAELAHLADLAPVLVWLNLARTKVGDAGLAAVAGLGELRRLNLSNTGIADAGLAHLAGLQKLEYLNLYGTAVTDAGLAHLHGLKTLQRLYLWQTAVTDAGAAALREAVPGVQIDRGEYVQERLLAAAKEIAERAARDKPANAECPVTGKPIDAATAIAHDGLRIAFCCDKCKAEFEKEPARFAEKAAAIRAAVAAAAKPVNETCPVSGKPVDPAHTLEHEGRKVAFCCGDCKAKFAADPKAYAEKLPK
jgi:YHS domain-containing protein/mono/diheme cytochrome c family protein